MWGCDSITFATTKDFGDSLYSNRGADVDVTEDGGTPDVEPVRVVGSQLLETTGLHQIHVFWHLDLARPGKMNGYYINKSTHLLLYTMKINREIINRGMVE